MNVKMHPLKTKPSCKDETGFSVKTHKGLPALFPICPHACIPSLCSTDITSMLHLKESKLGNEKCTEICQYYEIFNPAMRS